MPFDEVVASRKAASSVEIESHDGANRKQILQTRTRRHNDPAVPGRVVKARCEGRRSINHRERGSVVSKPRKIACHSIGVNVMDNQSIHTQPPMQKTRIDQESRIVSIEAENDGPIAGGICLIRGDSASTKA